MVIDQKQVLIKETIGNTSRIYDAASMRELLAKNGANYTLLDGSSMSPIPKVQGRQVGENLELLMPDGTSMTVSGYFPPGALPGDLVNTMAEFSAGTDVYFPDYNPAASMAGAGQQYASLGGAIMSAPAAAPAAAAPALGAGAMQAAAAALPAAAMMSSTPESSQTFNLPSSSAVTEGSSASEVYLNDLRVIKNDDGTATFSAWTNLAEGAVQFAVNGQILSAPIAEDGTASFTMPMAMVEQIPEGMVAYSVVVADANDALMQRHVGYFTFNEAVTEESPQITSITTSFGSFLSQEESEETAVLSVNVNSVNDGESVRLGLNGESFSAQVLGKKAVFLIPPSSLARFEQGSLEITASLEADPSIMRSLSVTVDTIEPSFLNGQDTVTITQPENVPTDDIVFTASASDTGEVNYSIAGDDAGEFRIDPVTGEVRFRNSPDYEVKNTYSLSVSATDRAGNSAQQLISIDITDLPEDQVQLPAIPTVNSLTTNSLTPTVSGTAVLQTNEVLTVRVSEAVYQVTPNASGAWSLNLATATPINDTSLTPLVDGQRYEIQATVTNQNTSASSSDTTSLELAIDTSTSGTPTVDTLATNTIPPIITGTAQVLADETLTVSINGATFDVVPENGQWSLDLGNATPIAGSLGQFVSGRQYEVAATVRDGSGNTDSDTTTNEVLIDQNAPILYMVIEQESESQLGQGDVATVTLTLTEPLASGQTLSASHFSITGGVLSEVQPTDTPLTYTANLTPASNFDGVLSVQLQSGILFDSAGNELILGNALSPRIDTVSPSSLNLLIDDLGVSASDELTADNSVTLQGLENTANWQYTLDEGATWSDGASNLNHFVLPDGTYSSGQVQARQIDVFGNVGESSALAIADELTIDSTRPEVLTAELSYSLAYENERLRAVGTVTLTFDDTSVLSGQVTDEDIVLVDNLQGASAQATGISFDETTRQVVFAFDGLLTDATDQLSVSNLFLNTLSVMDAAGNVPSTIIDGAVVSHTVGSQIIATGFEDISVLNPSNLDFHDQDPSADVSDGALTLVMRTTGLAEGQQVQLSLYDNGQLILKDTTTSNEGRAVFLLGAEDFGGANTQGIQYEAVIVDEDGSPVVGTLRSGLIGIDRLAPNFTEESPTEFQVPENAAWTGQQFLASDNSGTVTYSLLPEDQRYFSIDESTGVVSIKSSLSVLDHESMSDIPLVDNSDPSSDRELSLTVVATDVAGNESRHLTRVRVQDVDESSPSSEQSNIQVELAENSGGGQQVYVGSEQFSDSADIDDTTDTSSSLTYSFKLDEQGDPVLDGSLFSIDPESGAVLLSLNPDYEARNEFMFTVVARDAEGNQSEQTVTLNIADQDEVVDVSAPNFVFVNAPNLQDQIEISGDTLNLSIPENTTTTGFVYRFTLDDPTASVSLVGADRDAFTLTSNVDEEGQNLVVELNFDSEQWPTIDFESGKTSFDVGLNATDSSGNSKLLNINVAVLDEPAPVFSSADEVTLTEGRDAPGTIIYQAETTTTTDAPVSYSLVSQTPDLGLFQINSQTGEVTLARVLDAEEQTEHSFVIQAEQNNEISTQSVSVDVLDASGPSITGVSWDESLISLNGLVPISLTFDAPVQVTGTPKIRLVDAQTHGELLDVTASYNDGSASNTLTFSWVVGEGISLTDEEVLLEAVVLTNNSSIQALGGAAADLGFHNQSLGIVSINTDQPDLTAISVDDGGNLILTFSEPLAFVDGGSLSVSKDGVNLGEFTFIADEITPAPAAFDSITLAGAPLGSDDQDDLAEFLNGGNSTALLVNATGVTGQSSGLAPESVYWSDALGLSITPAAGRFVSDGLAVRIFDDEGQLISQTDFNPLDGVVRYQDLLPDGYRGKLLVQIIDVNGLTEDYLDEFTNQWTDLGATTQGFGLRAVVDYSPGLAASAITVSPLSELAVRLVEGQALAPTDPYIDTVEALLVSFFQMSGATHGGVDFITDGGFDLDDGVSATEHYGLVLAALSTLDNVSGGIHDTLSLLVKTDRESQEHRDEMIEQAVLNVRSSDNPFIIDVADELSVLLERFYQFNDVLLAIEGSNLMDTEAGWGDEQQLDLSDLFEGDTDYDLIFEETGFAMSASNEIELNVEGNSDQSWNAHAANTSSLEPEFYVDEGQLYG